MKKTITQIVLAIVVVVLAYLLYDSLMTPVRFDDTRIAREKAVIERISDIRSAQRGYKQVHGKYTGSFDTLINFVLTAEMQFERQLVSSDDSVGLALLKKAGKKNIEKFTMPAIDTVFGAKKLTPDQVKELRYVPFTHHQREFILEAAQLTTGSGVVVPVVECRVPYKLFLDTVTYRQEVINLIDNEENNFNRYAGVKFGDINAANNEAGNWED